MQQLGKRKMHTDLYNEKYYTDEYISHSCDYICPNKIKEESIEFFLIWGILMAAFIAILTGVAIASAEWDIKKGWPCWILGLLLAFIAALVGSNL